MARPLKRPKIESLLDIVFKRFETFKDPRKSPTKIELSDFLKSAYSIFHLKHPSLLSFEKQYKQEELIHHNLKRLMNIKNIPSDTHLRDVLDLVDHNQYREVFKDVFSHIQQTKLLEQFSFIDIEDKKYYLLAVDGTGYFSSNKVRCKQCSLYHEDNDEKQTRFGHNVLAASLVHPNKKEVISFYPEPIMKQDGIKKNDCEYNAFKRFLERFKQDHPKLRVIFLLDALYANTALVKLLEGYDYPYIISVKETKSTLFMKFREQQKSELTIKEVDTFELGDKVKKLKTKTYEYAQNLQLNQDRDSSKVHFVNFKENISWTNRKGELKEEVKKFSYITNIETTPTSIRMIVQGGRTRWKIENETFNTLKNQGYNLEHNYGHGNNNLSLNFINTMFLTFLLDQVQQASCQKFKRLLERMGTKRALWEKIRSIFDICIFEDWDNFWGVVLKEQPPNTG